MVQCCISSFDVENSKNWLLFELFSQTVCSFIWPAPGSACYYLSNKICDFCCLLIYKIENNIQ